MLALIVLLPLLAATLGIFLVKDPKIVKYIAVAGAALALISILTVSYGSTELPWITLGTYVINISIALSPLNYLLLAIVLGIGLLVMVYSAGFMETISEHRRFYIEMLAFEAAMAAFALSGSFVLLFIAWGFLSFTSYLLIGFWNERDSANRAARKALTIIFIGDLALLASIVLFWNVFGTLQFAQIISSLAMHQSLRLDLATMLLLVAIFTKSAQFPFHEWLIDAMEGPTPVSAYLHSSTMVKAGVFVVILLYPIFAIAPTSQIIMAIGLITAVLATLAASKEMHIKKVIAYSTIQELSIMLVALGAGAVLAAIYFFLVQSFYKALLFFSAGASIKATGSEQLDKAGGIKYNKLLFYSTAFGVLSLAGFIPFSGFFANDAIDTSIAANLLVYVIITAISMLTSFYIFRWMSYLARDPKKGNAQFEYTAQPKSMIYSIVALASLTVAASALFIYLPTFLNSSNTPSYIEANNVLSINIMDAIIFTIIIAIGAFLAYSSYYKGSIKTKFKAPNLIYTAPIINWAYMYISKAAWNLSEGATAFDNFVSEGFDQFGRLTISSGYSIRKLSVGNVNSYAIVFIIGFVVLSVSFYYLVIV